MENEALFHKNGYLSDYFDKEKIQIKNEIEDIPKDQLMLSLEDELVEYLSEKYKLHTPVIYKDSIEITEPRDTYFKRRDYGEIINAKGIEFDVIIPFEGDHELFHYQPSHFTLSKPRGMVENFKKEIRVSYRFLIQEQVQFKEENDRNIANINGYLDYVKSDVDKHNNNLKRYIREIITYRKSEIQKTRAFTENLGLPIRREGNTNQQLKVPLVRKNLYYQELNKKPKSSEPEYLLDYTQYEDILSIIKNTGIEFERHPDTIIGLNEESIRSLFLVPLNGAFSGIGSGETFNKLGKTDILMRYKNNNVFIAECKFWDGEKIVLDSIDQLFKYITWRDTKTALMIFSKLKGFTSVVKQIPAIIASHPNYFMPDKIENSDLINETISRYKFHHPDDEEREITLTVMLFNIPQN